MHTIHIDDVQVSGPSIQLQGSDKQQPFKVPQPAKAPRPSRIVLAQPAKVSSPTVARGPAKVLQRTEAPQPEFVLCSPPGNLFPPAVEKKQTPQIYMQADMAGITEGKQDGSSSGSEFSSLSDPEFLSGEVEDSDTINFVLSSTLSGKRKT